MRTPNGADCNCCKYLDKTRTYYWSGAFCTLYVCRRKEMIEKAIANRMNEKPYGFIPSDLKVDGKLLGYAWKCENEPIPEELEPYLNEMQF